MAAHKKQEEEINLLPQKGFQTSTAGRVLAWILSTFRIIVIITEIIVMIAFLSRFWFDAQNSDLNETLQHKQAVLSASQEFEIKYKDVQRRLEIFSSLDKYVDSNTKALIAIKKSLPPDVLLVKLLSEKENIKITCITPNEKGIQQMIVNLSSNNIFADVNLAEAGTQLNDPTLFTFTVIARRGSESKPTS